MVVGLAEVKAKREEENVDEREEERMDEVEKSHGWSGCLAVVRHPPSSSVMAPSMI